VLIVTKSHVTKAHIATATGEAHLVWIKIQLIHHKAMV